MSTDPKKHCGSEREQALQCLNGIVWQLQLAYRKTGACECSGREEIRSALDIALQARATLAASESESGYSETLSTVWFLFEFAKKVVEMVSSISNDYSFPEDYGYRVDHTEAA